MELTANNVNDIVHKVLCGEDNGDTALKVEGITAIWGFNKEKLEEHREDIKSMLSQLPKQFFDTAIEGGGGGWTFLYACDRADGVQWTGMHRVMEALFVMGIGLNMVAWLMPKMMWRVLPGGVPYVIVNPDGIREGSVIPDPSEKTEDLDTKVLRLYNEEHMSPEEIAKKLRVRLSAVSRIIEDQQVAEVVPNA